MLRTKIAAIGNEEDRRKLEDKLRNINSTSRAGLYKSIMKNYSGADYGDRNWSETDGSWDSKISIYGLFAKENEKFLQLALNPGFIAHLKEFSDFKETCDINSMNYLELRNKFKEYLGYKEVWHGLFLTAGEAERVKKEGLKSRFLRMTNENEEQITKRDGSLTNYLEGGVLSSNFNSLIEKHFHIGNTISPLISVSAHEDVAIAVSKKGRQNSEKSNFYLLKLKVPEIDLIYYTSWGAHMPVLLKDRLASVTRDIEISVNGQQKAYAFDKDVESYMFLKIDPDEIKEIIKPEIYESSYL